MNLLAQAILAVLIFVIPSLLLIYQYILFRNGMKFDDSLEPLYDSNLPNLSILVPIKGEKQETLQSLLSNLSSIKWDKNRLEVIVISDDSEDYFNNLVHNLKIPEGLDVKIVRREKKIGYKSGALAYGYSLSKGDLILTLDVDAKLEENSLIKAFNHLRALGCDAVTLSWIGYSNNNHSTLAKGVMISTAIADRALLNGRDKVGLRIFPVGCGTMFKREAIENVGPWDPSMVQDDLEIGARLLRSGKRICSSTSPVYVEVPDNLVSFYVQQTRWAMGSIEVLTRRFKDIMSKSLTIKQKIDILIFLLQYVPIALTFLAALALAIFSFAGVIYGVPDYLRTPVIFLWMVSLSIYGYNFVKNALKQGFKLIEALRSLGKISSYTVAISPFILIGLISGLREHRKYVVTPKGVKVQTTIGYPIAAFGIVFLVSALIYLVHSAWITGLWLLYYSMGYIFTVATFKREV
ncbi:glycosyltransferase [Metallosphaera hakonensis]|uniref:Glycosyl transferase family 2 n=1 Tax=Metallosphaera hakonensis JCM 8857 = DSM 7519 TaxID=1293036 RepID=A0A2U9IUG6_9CREN|nr:glycosyltransferase family 2 protein [Metallosphaera hakonensis]AWR99625.1 glycosyltransferase [Metallosphaera hakonensis JCM 8857 = DSM 7519]